MFRTLRSRLAVVGLLAALVAVVVTAVSVQQLTERDLRSSIDRDLDLELEIRDEIAFYGFAAGGWDGVDATVADIASRTGERIAVATLGGTILADSEQLLFGEEAPLPSQPTIVDPESTLVDFGFDDPESDLLEGAPEMQAVADCLTELGVDVVLIDDGFGSVLAIPDGELAADEEVLFLECAQASGVFEPEFFLDHELIEEAFEGDLDDLLDDVDEVDVEPVQLFIGYGDGRDDVVQNTLRSATFWIAVGSVLALAVAAALYLGSRLTRPLTSLTAAARRMSHGDLSARASVGGVDEMASLGTAFNDMANSLEAEDQARKTLTTDVAHELRSPLANLRGYLEGIQDGVVDPDTATIASLHEEVTAMQGLVDDLQQLSLAETGRLHLQLEHADIGDLIERSVTAHQALAAAGGVALTATTTQGVIGHVDTDRLRQVLANLVGNAIRHTPDGGTVDVTLSSAEADQIVIEVRDTGPGIEAHHLPHLFDRFYRADASRNRATGGSGLGLAITQELVTAHGGTVGVTSQVGVGTTFTVRLPAPETVATR